MPKKLTKPEAGHFAKAGVQPGRRVVELRLDSVDGFEVGQEIKVDTAGRRASKVDVTAVSRGKGFAGGMKRHNFKGQGASHGNHKHHRAPGSIGSASYPRPSVQGPEDGRPHGPRAGHHAQPRSRRRPTPSATCCWCKGSVPGPNGGVVIVRNAVKGK